MSTPAARPSALRRLGRLLAQLAGISLITFAIVEVGARVVLGVQPLTAGTFLFELSETRGWQHRKLAEETFVKIGTRQVIKINSLGLREREIPYEKAPGTYRVLVVGDSQVVGFEVAPEDTYTRVLERELRNAGVQAQVINGGHRGYGTDQALLFLREEGLKYDPDLVLYHWTSNDRDDNTAVHRPFRRFGKPWFEIDEAGELELKGQPVPEYEYASGLRVNEAGDIYEIPVTWKKRAQIFLRDEVICRSSFAVVLTTLAVAVPAATSSMMTAGSYGDFSGMSPSEDPGSRLNRLAAALVVQLQRETEAHGADFRMMGGIGRGGRLILEMTGVPEIDRAWRLFQERTKGKQSRIPYDPHLNEWGHEVYGMALAEVLLEEGILPQPGMDVARP